MRRSKITNWLVLIALCVCVTIASSWFGAVLYVRHYPNLIEYLEPARLMTPAGEPLTQISTSRPTPFIMNAKARRQPFHCWGAYNYFFDGARANYQFYTLRSQGLNSNVQEVLVKNFFVLPAGLPKGTYKFKVVIFPTCDGVDVPPTTIDLGTSIEVVD